LTAGDDWIIWISCCCAHYGFTAAVRRKNCRAVYAKIGREWGREGKPN